MQVLSKNFGPYMTNCYIVKTPGGDIIIDPGEGAKEWVKQNAKDAKAILCTHGHFDHIFDVKALKDELGLPVYINENDAFMVQSDVFGYGYECFTADVLISGDKEIMIGDMSVRFYLFSGHTPGCSMIQIGEAMFSGDFLFKDSIGRWDFPYSNKEDMIKSLEKCKNLRGDFILHPGHGEPSTLKREQENLDMWIRYVRKS
ncbi:MBL fold metallo-hydrolase [Campylobacter curvus]|uniref:MBL fold metallo-hydrolase n=1 Tax=Campylobacter curvus TaxID=200 RepID=UPI00036A8F46|nr:MBL fold metallo-hydrolase [Campylobacter curvus]QKF61061.1 metallo-beta-lactamase family protein [Campylobacter curvus]UEB49380.1 MBL fold metallo-hydrolase [Campylobacter curvus]